MNYGKRIALSPRANAITDSEEDYEDDVRSNKRVAGKDKQTRNLSEKKRRDQFNVLVNELGTMVSHTVSKKMDKSTVLKSTIAFLKNYQETTTQAQEHEIKEVWKPSFLTNDEFMHLMLEALDSFLLVCTQQGTILYASEGITSLLGHLPGDLQNRSITSLVNEREKANLQNLLYNYTVVAGDGVPEYEKEENQLCFECHMRRAGLDLKGPIVYEPVTVMGSFRHSNGSQLGEEKHTISKDQIYFCSTVRLKNSQLVHEISTVDDNGDFKSRHSLEWKFLFLDHRAPPIIGYLPFEVLGTSGYDYYHPDDLDGVTKSHEQLMKTGEGTSCYYRFLTKGQQWIWLKTKYYITYHQWSSKPEFINCTNTVVSYADVRAQKRRELGIREDEVAKIEPDVSFFIHKMSRSSSVTSGGQPVSNLSACTTTQDSHNDPALGYAILEKDLSSRPSSTSSSNRSKEQLQEFLQRHIHQQEEEQQLQQAQAGSSSSHHSLSGRVSQHHTSFSTQSLQQYLLRRQQQRQEHVDVPQPIKQDTRSQRILPRPSSSHDHQKVVQQQFVSNSDPTPVTVTLPTHQAVSSLVPDNISPKNIYMTPVQKQLHRQLQRKASQVQDAILRQQEELRAITQQLAFTQGMLPVMGGPNVGGDNMVGMIGSASQQVTSSDPQGSMGNVQGQVTASSSLTHQHPAHHHQQQQQQQQQHIQQGVGQQIQVLNMGPPTTMMDSTQFLTFPVLPYDPEVHMSYADSSEKHPGMN